MTCSLGKYIPLRHVSAKYSMTRYTCLRLTSCSRKLGLLDSPVLIRGCCDWQQCEVGRACAGSRRAERRKQAAR